jgi:gamma-glutamylcyclotransferase (GGCT)/AIG2-like uncharacterized protein YtfP
MSHHVFVYGTLKAGWSNHAILRSFAAVNQAEFMGDASTVTNTQLWFAGLPYLIKSEEDEPPVPGEVYLVSDRCLEFMDHLEGHPRAYRREEIQVKMEAGEEMTVLCYLWPRALHDAAQPYRIPAFTRDDLERAYLENIYILGRGVEDHE